MAQECPMMPQDLDAFCKRAAVALRATEERLATAQQQLHERTAAQSAENTHGTATFATVAAVNGAGLQQTRREAGGHASTREVARTPLASPALVAMWQAAVDRLHKVICRLPTAS